MFDKNKVVEKLNNNIFTLPQYTVSVDMFDMFVTLARFTNRDTGYRDLDSQQDALTDIVEYTKFADLVLSAVPPFQRDNDKWSRDMQSSYILNCLMGMKSQPITLYSIDGTKNNCLILDGLQRLTAFYDFIIGNKLSFVVDGEDVTSQDMLGLANEKLLNAFHWSPFNVIILHFDSELEAVDHYIQSNQFITHSEADIQRAIDYRNKLIAEMQ